jgi:hypothetical protein
MKLSKNLSLLECTKSNTARRLNIDNTPSEAVIDSLKLIAQKVFQPLRDYYNLPIGVSSGYRSQELNKAIGGSKTSQHCKGEALDLDADIYGGLTNKQIFDYIKDNLEFDQLIWEYGDNKTPDWVHVSYKKENNRLQVLRCERVNGMAQYAIHT